MNQLEIKDYILKTFQDVEMVNDFGYEMFFYKSDRKLSFVTMIDSDYEYDNVSNLNREGVFRLNIGISKKTFQSLFGKEKVDSSKYDFTALDLIMPHPEYAEYNFVCVLSSSDETFKKVRPLLDEAYDIAVRRFKSQNKP